MIVGRLPDVPLDADLPMSASLISQGLEHYQAVARWIATLPFGRNTNPLDWRLVVSEKRGTSSTKHAFLAELARELETRGLMPVIALGPVEEQLNPDRFDWKAVLIHQTAAAVPQLLEPVRQRKLPVKIVVRLTAGDVSELEPWVASAAELVTPADWPRQRAAERIANLLM